MKNLSKIGLLALIVTVSFAACTKNNSVSPKTNATVNTGATALNKANASISLVKRDTITPIKLIVPFKRDTITPIKIIISPNLRRDTITPQR